MMKQRRIPNVAMLLAAALALVLGAADAWAAGSVSMGTFSCSGGNANGHLLVSDGTCPTTLSMDHLLSFLICNFEQLSADLMGHMFCGMINSLAPAVWAAITLATLFFGIGFTIGLIPFTGREALKFTLKIALVAGFATNADLLIGYGYSFFIGAMSDGSNLALKIINSTGLTNSSDVYGEFDKFLAGIFHMATDANSSDAIKHACDLDANSDACKTPDKLCQNAIFAVISLMLVILPMVAYIGILLFARLLLTIFRAVFGYIYALIGIVFLLALAPFFISFALFRQTSNLFDRWLGYMVSFALQVVLLFSFLAFVVLVEQAVIKDNILKNLTEVIMYDQTAPEATSLRGHLTYCTLCEFDVVDATSGATLNENDPNYSTKGKLQCKTPKKPITPTFATSSDSRNQIKQILTLLGSGLLPLLVLALIMENLLQLIPGLAQRLASNMGASYATQIGGGYNPTVPTTSMPFESVLQDTGVGFDSAYRRGTSANTVGRVMQGIRGGTEGLLHGTYIEGGTGTHDKYGKQILGGTTNMFARWVSDPNRFGL